MTEVGTHIRSWARGTDLGKDIIYVRNLDGWVLCFGTGWYRLLTLRIGWKTGTGMDWIRTGWCESGL